MIDHVKLVFMMGFLLFRVKSLLDCKMFSQTQVKPRPWLRPLDGVLDIVVLNSQMYSESAVSREWFLIIKITIIVIIIIIIMTIIMIMMMMMMMMMIIIIIIIIIINVFIEKHSKQTCGLTIIV